MVIVTISAATTSSMSLDSPILARGVVSGTTMINKAAAQPHCSRPTLAAVYVGGGISLSQWLCLCYPSLPIASSF